MNFSAINRNVLPAPGHDVVEAFPPMKDLGPPPIDALSHCEGLVAKLLQWPDMCRR